MKLNKLILVCTMLIAIPYSAHAGIMIEPWLGYEVGELKCTYVGNTDCAGDVKGMALGGRLGYKSMIGLWLAADYSVTSGMKTTRPGGQPDADFERTSLGATVGIDLILGLRFFAGYIFDDKLDLKDPGSAKLSHTGGTGTKFGVGYKLPLLPLAFNFEMVTSEYDKVSQSGNKFNVSQLYSTFKHSGYIVSVSAPLDF